MVDETLKDKDKSSAKPDETSSQKKGTSKGKLYTEDAITKIKSDAAAEAGRQRKAAEQERDTLKQQLESTNNRLDLLERKQAESLYAEARTAGPEALNAYQKEQTSGKLQRELDDREIDLKRREEQVKSDREGVDKDKHTVSVAYLAAKHGLETEELESLGINDPDTLERVAEKLAGRPKTEPGEGGEEETPSGEAPELLVDSGEGTGSVGGALTTESVERDSIASVAKSLEKTSDK